jgi:heme a synthase
MRARLPERLQTTPEQYARVALVALVSLSLIVVTGAAVRLTGSGLGCPDWPACQGRLIPNFADAHVAIEYAHRLVGSGSGLLMVATAAAATWLYLRRRDEAMPRGLVVAAIAGVLLIVFQGVLGGITVLTGNTPYTVAMHLGNALLVLGAAALVALWASRALAASPGTPGRASQAQAAAIFGAATAAFVIVLSGAYVVGTSAGAACAGWPLCGSALRTPFTDVHMLHRIVVGVGSVVILAAAWQGARRWRGRPMAATSYLTAALLLAEVAVGGAQAVLSLPSPLRALHVALASLVWTGAILMAEALWLETRPAAARQAEPGRSLAGAGAKP